MQLEWKLFADLKERAGDGRVTVDGEDAFTMREGLATAVEEGTELALFPPVSGGRR